MQAIHFKENLKNTIIKILRGYRVESQYMI